MSLEHFPFIGWPDRRSYQRGWRRGGWLGREASLEIELRHRHRLRAPRMWCGDCWCPGVSQCHGRARSQARVGRPTGSRKDRMGGPGVSVAVELNGCYRRRQATEESHP